MDNATEPSSHASRSDVRGATRGEVLSFDGLVDENLRAVRSYALSRVGPNLADDVVSETFLLAYRIRVRLPHAPEGHPRPWLLGIATNVIAQQRRSEKHWLQKAHRAQELVEEWNPARDDEVVSRLDAGSRALSVTAALVRLRAGDRDALLLHVLMDLSYEEVALALEIPIGTVRSRIHRARKKMQQRLGATHE